VRLDHLLSKEHLVLWLPVWVVMGSRRRVTRTWLPVAHGWNIDSAVGSDAFDLQYTGLCLVGTGRGGAAGWCTLLGPEGPGFLLVMPVMGVGGGGWAARVVRDLWVSFGGLHEAGAFASGECGADRMLRTTQWTRASFRSLAMMITFRGGLVDESIAILIFVVKFLRANGGCLGIWSRRRT
jgi:hypothetical protein